MTDPPPSDVRALGPPKRMTLHVYRGNVPVEGDVLRRVHDTGPQHGEPTRAAPMLVLDLWPITRGTCDRCDECTRWRIEYLRIDPATVPAGARIHQTTRLPPKPRRV